MGAIRAIKLNKLFKLYATFSVAFLLAYIISGVVSPISNSSAVECVNGMISGTSDICGTDTTDVNVSIEGAWTVAVSSSGTLNVDITPKGSGTTSTTTDSVNIYTNTPNGYQLYLNSTTGSTDIYNNNVLDGNGNLNANLPANTNTNHFVATTGTKASPATLANNSWGYSLVSNPTTFSKVEETSSTSDSLIRTTTTKTSGSGDNLDVTFGFNADTKLTPGTYTTSVTYTAVAEVPSYTLSSISPNRPAYNTSNIPVTIVTTTPASELGLGNIAAKIGTVDLTNCSETIVNSFRGATCTYLGGLSAGRYNVELTSSWHNATYTLSNAFTINSMQEFTSINCTNLPESTTTVDNRIDLVDSRDGKSYKVSKLADGNCWMVNNLALDGGRTITGADSNLPANTSVILPETASSGSSNMETIQIWAQRSGSDGNYYNWCAAIASVNNCSATTEQTTSICPKGWRLPSGTGNPSYSYLFNVSGISDLPNGEQKINAAQSAPYYFTKSGYYNSKYAGIDNNGNYSTRSTYSSDTSLIALFYYRDISTFAGYLPGSRPIGNSLRCVFGS